VIIKLASLLFIILIPNQNNITENAIVLLIWLNYSIN